ncbi:MAG: NHL repeat-containing protein [Coriobacteriia bacterium]|nr:NHL repeat-containing protein [Coriobacteriia bacterium]
MSETATQNDDQQAWREADRRRIQRTRRTLVAVLVVLVILLLIASYALVQIFQPPGRIATTQEAQGVTWVRSIYGWGNGPDQQFWGPQGTAIGPDGTIWATTQGQNRVVGFNPDGSFNAMLYQGPAGDPKYPNAFTFPVAVAVDPAGLIYIADQPRSTVWVVTRDNKIVRSIFVPTPSSLAVTNNRLVVGSASGFVIMTPSGQVVKVLGTQGKGIDQFQGVRGVAIGNDGTIYVVDQYNNRVSAYDTNGKRKWIVNTGSPGNKKQVSASTVATTSGQPANMQIPAGLTIDGAGRLVIADPFGFDLTVLSSKDGRLIAKYGAPGTIDGQFVYPSSVAYDSFRDWFVVADTQNARLQIIRIPNSGGSAGASVSRALSGPLRACIIPLLLIILAIIAGIIYRIVKRRRKKRALTAATPSAEQPDEE